MGWGVGGCRGSGQPEGENRRVRLKTKTNEDERFIHEVDLMLMDRNMASRIERLFPLLVVLVFMSKLPQHTLALLTPSPYLE